MDKKMLEAMKGLSREERLAMLKSKNPRLIDDSSLDAVNGGAAEAGCRKPRKIRKQIESDSATSCLGAVVIYI